MPVTDDQMVDVACLGAVAKNLDRKIDNILSGGGSSSRA